MNKSLTFLLGISFILLLAGCSNNNDGNNSGQPSVQNPTGSPDEAANQAENYAEMGLKEDWEPTGWTGIDENARINIKRDLSELADYDELPICYSEAYDAIYYINYSDNGFIYRCKDNEVRVAVKIPADNLYTKNGELYFRVTGVYDDLKGVKEGDICKYSPVTGKVDKLIGNAGASWMTVSENYIYYTNTGELREVVSEDGIYYARSSKVFCYNFEKAVSEKVEANSAFLLWKEDYGIITYSSSLQGGNEGIIGLGLHRIGTDLSDVEPVILGGRYTTYCVQGDLLYCTGPEGLNLVHLNTGEIKKYAYQILENGSSNGLRDFMIQNNRVYQQHLTYFIDLETGKCHDLDGAEGRRISRLFNINNKLYALYYETGYNSIDPTGTPEIVEVVIDEETTVTEKGEVFCYRIKRIGEE